MRQAPLWVHFSCKAAWDEKGPGSGSYRQTCPTGCAGLAMASRKASGIHAPRLSKGTHWAADEPLGLTVPVARPAGPELALPPLLLPPPPQTTAAQELPIGVLEKEPQQASASRLPMHQAPIPCCGFGPAWLAPGCSRAVKQRTVHIGEALAVSAVWRHRITGWPPICNVSRLACPEWQRVRMRHSMTGPWRCWEPRGRLCQTGSSAESRHACRRRWTAVCGRAGSCCTAT